jgi:hypothetical protein
MNIAAITNETELVRTTEELKRARRDKNMRQLRHLTDAEQDAEIKALSMSIKNYEQQMESSQHPLEKGINYVEKMMMTPLVKMLWTVCVGIGIFLLDKLAIATAALSTFLFPLHFCMEIIRSSWDLFRDIRNKSKAQRKTSIVVNALTLAGMAMGLAVFFTTALANPLSLPIIFAVMVGAGLYKEAYTYHQHRKLQNQTAGDLRTVKRELQALEITGATNGNIHSRLKLKEQRLESQLAAQQQNPLEMPRRIALNSAMLIAVGFLIADAVLTIAFPPYAAVALTLKSIGFLLFGSAAIASVLTSPPVLDRVKKVGAWIKNKFTKQSPEIEVVAEQNNNLIEPLLFNTNNANENAVIPQPARPVAYRARANSHPGFFDHSARRAIANENLEAPKQTNALRYT